MNKVVFLLLFIVFSMTGNFAKGELIRVGVTAGPHGDILDFVQKKAEAQGLQIKIVEFNDFILPNSALDHGDIDMNIYQHEPFLEDQVKTRGYRIIAIGKNILLPMGIYSKKHKRIADIPQGAKIAIPNDPTNGGRALMLLQMQGVLELRSHSLSLPSVLDIKSNPKKVKIIEMESPQLVRALQDVDFAVINTDWALLAGLNPIQDGLAFEEENKLYSNVFVVRKVEANRDAFKKLIELYQSDETVQFIRNRFGRAVVPSWVAEE